MITIKDQLISEDWHLWKKNYFYENDYKVCDSCGSELELDLYIREFHHEIQYIWDYPHSAFGSACSECRSTKMKRIKEVKQMLGRWNVSELDALLDVLDNVEASQTDRSHAVEQLYSLSKQLRYNYT